MASGGLRGHREELAGRVLGLAEMLRAGSAQAAEIAIETGDALAMALAGRTCHATGSAFNFAGAILHGRVPMAGEAPRKPEVVPMGAPGPRAGEPITEMVEVLLAGDDIEWCGGGDELKTILVRAGRPGAMAPRLLIRADSWDGLVDVARREVPGLPEEIQILGRPEPMPLESLFGLKMIEFRNPGVEYDDLDDESEAPGVAPPDPDGPDSDEGGAEVLPMVPGESAPDDDGPIAAESDDEWRRGREEIARLIPGIAPILAEDPPAEAPAPPEPSPAKKKSKRSWDLVRQIPGSSFIPAWLARIWVETAEEAQRFVDLAPFGDRRTIAVCKASARYSQEVTNAGGGRVVKVGGGLFKVATRHQLDDEDPARDDVAPPAPEPAAPAQTGPAAPEPSGEDEATKLDPYDVTYRGPHGVTFVGRIMAASSRSARSLFSLLVGHDPAASKGSLFAAIAWPSSQYDAIVAGLGGLRPVWAEDLGNFEVCFAPACESLFGFDVADAYAGIARPEPADAPPPDPEGPEAGPEASPPDPRAGLFDIYFRLDKEKPRFVGRIASEGDDEDAEIAFMDLIGHAGSAPGQFLAFPALSENDATVESSGGMAETTAEWDTGTRTFRACVPPDALALFRILDAEAPESAPDLSDLAEQAEREEVEEAQAEEEAAERSRAVREDLAIAPEKVAGGPDDQAVLDAEAGMTPDPDYYAFDLFAVHEGQPPRWIGRMEAEDIEAAESEFAELLDADAHSDASRRIKAVESLLIHESDVEDHGGMVEHHPDHLVWSCRACVHPDAREILDPPAPPPSDGLGIRPGDFIRTSLGPEIFRVESRAKVDKIECPVHGKMCKAGRDVWNLIAVQVDPTPKRGPGLAKDATRRFEGFYHDGRRVRVAHSPCERAVDTDPLTLEVVGPPAAPKSQAPGKSAPIKAELPARDFDVTFHPRVGRETWLARVAAQTPQGARAVVVQRLDPPAGSPALLAYPAERRWDAKVQALGGMAAIAVDAGEPTERVIRLRVDLAVAEQHGLTAPDPDPDDPEGGPTAPTLEKGYSWWDLSVRDAGDHAHISGWLARLPARSEATAMGRACEAIHSLPVGLEYHAEPARGLNDALVARAGGLRDHPEGPGFPFAAHGDAEEIIRTAFERAKQRRREALAGPEQPATAEPSRPMIPDAFRPREGLRWHDVFLKHATDGPANMQWIARVEARGTRLAEYWAAEAIADNLPEGFDYYATHAMPMHDKDVARAGGFSGNPYRAIRHDLARVMAEAARRSAEAARPAPIEPDAKYVDALVAEALHRADGASRRWEMRRASGQSGRDLKAAVSLELNEVPPPPHAAYSVEGGMGHPVFTIRATDGPVPTKAVELDVHALAVRARRLLAIPTRGEPEPAEVWAVRAGATDAIRYAIDAPTAEDAAELMEPGDVGDPRVKFGRVKTAKVPEWVEIRRMPRPDPAPAPGDVQTGVQTVPGDVQAPDLGPSPADAAPATKAPARTKDVDRALQVLFMGLAGEVTGMMGEGDGGDDEALAAAIASDLDPPGSRAKPFPTCWRGGPNPGFWFGQAEPEGRPTLAGKELVRRVRQVLEIPYADGTLPPPKRLGRKPRETAV